MNKIKLLVLILFIFILTGCKVPEEEKPFDPDVVEVSIVSKGNLVQMEEAVSEVTFSITHNQEKYEPKKIVWIKNLLEVHEGESYSFTPTEGLISKADISAKVYFEVEENEYTYTTKILTIRVSGRTADIELKTNHELVNNSIIDNVLTSSTNSIKFEAIVTGDYGVRDLRWVVIDEVTNEEIHLSEFDGLDKFSYTPTKAGVLVVKAEVASGKFESNKIYISSNYGKLELNQNIIDDTTIEVTSSFSSDISGTYRWERLNQDSNTYEPINLETDNSVNIDLETVDGSILLRSVFTSIDNTYNVISDSILIVDEKTVVRNEEELLAAIENKAKVIELASDITYTKVDEVGGKKNPIIINYPVTFLGNNNTLSSLGIFTFIQVESDNVWFKNIKIDHSSRYNVLVSRSKNVYFEDVEFIRPGGGSSATDPGAGIYAHGSDVVVKNIKITKAFNSGFRVEAFYQSDEIVHKSNITILGKFEYNVSELFAPVVSVTSKSTDANITALGFDEFVIPIGSGKMIRRWSSDPYGIKWQLKEPYQIEYKPGSPIDFSGITINVRIGKNESTDFGLEFVYLFLDLFKETGKIRITRPNDINNPISEYIIYDFDRSNPGDHLLYKDTNGNATQPFLPNEAGDFQVHIWVGDSMEGEGLYLGYIVVRTGLITE